MALPTWPECSSLRTDGRRGVIRTGWCTPGWKDFVHGFGGRHSEEEFRVFRFGWFRFQFRIRFLPFRHRGGVARRRAPGSPGGRLWGPGITS